ncbi:MAG: hypothetical protein FJ276_10730, partial [Planctomycetes bacterium]|nr:hypothetical protein [Planctomycetota bacterium]
MKKTGGLGSLVRSLASLAARLRAACNEVPSCPGDIGQAPVSTVHAAIGDADVLLTVLALFLARCRMREPAVGQAGHLAQIAEFADQPHLVEMLARYIAMAQGPGDCGAAAGEMWDLLSRTDTTSVLEEAAERGRTSHPLVHFHELLLGQYDASSRRRCGIYFTPQPLVQFIVASVDALLRRDLGLGDGLATRQARLRIVDPACGSGAFVLGVLDHIRREFEEAGDLEAWRNFVAGEMAHRVIGVDLMTACCGAVQLILEHTLARDEWLRPLFCANDGGPTTKRRWGVYCTNLLEDTAFGEWLFTDRVPVIIGNPPYSNFGRRNRGSWILEQLTEYKLSLQERKLNLNDDFIKFLRWGQYWIDRAGRGVLAMVTSNTYLSGLTHRRMRSSLARTFDRIYVLDLHGDWKKRVSEQHDTADENVFPIQQGVAIGLFVKSGGATSSSTGVFHASVSGTRSEKLDAISRTDVRGVAWTRLNPCEPHHWFVPRDDGDLTAYLEWPRLDEIFREYLSGVQTKRDALFVGFTFEEVEENLRLFLRAAAAGDFTADVPRWLQRKTRGVAFDAAAIQPYMVAPFDVRWVYYEPRLLGRARHAVMQHVSRQNHVLVFMRQTTNAGAYDHFLATNTLVSDRVFFSARGAPFVAPLFRPFMGRRTTNLAPRFLESLADRLGVRFDDDREESAAAFGSLDVFHWIYAVVHGRDYRNRFDAMLRVDFPRIRWPRHLDDFRRLGAIGRQLARLHLEMARPDFGDEVSAHAPQPPGARVQSGYPRWEPPGRLRLSRDCSWPEPVNQEVWQWRLGGYPVLARWLAQRRHRELTPGDRYHLARMIAGIGRTEVLVREIDSAVP